jgi:hypothetical protein
MKIKFFLTSVVVDVFGREQSSDEVEGWTVG